MLKYKWFLGFFVVCTLIGGLSKNAMGLNFGDPIGSDFKYYSRTVQDSPQHDGLDIVGKSKGKIKSQNTYASEDGTVIFAGEGKPYTGYGNIVVIDHGDGYQTRYAHLESIDDAAMKAYENYKKGDKENAKIVKGKLIGKIDATGISKPPGAHHLHFEIRKDGTPQNPLDYLPCCYQKQPSGAKGGPGGTDSSSPGGDHPDDTFSIEDATFPTTPVDLENAYYRLASNKGKTVVINYFTFKNLIKERDTYLENLPDGSIPDQNYIENLEIRTSQLYESFGTEQESFWQEYETVPDVAVFQNGYIDESTAILNKFLEPAEETSVSFNPLDITGQSVLIIPSGGLYGLENSAFLKVQLDEYVKQGGTLIVFAQQHGYEFNVLPVPLETDRTFRNITGYGWTEDQSCFTNAVYIDTQHQMLSSISKSTPTLSVDGYFTNYPANTTVLLSRTANGQPAMIMYDHGLGKVIVSSMYSDFAMSHNQASIEELALVRDMISWAKKPATLPEVKPGETVSVSVTVKNVTTTDAGSIKFLIYNPDRTTVVSEQFLAVSIPAGFSSQLITHYASPITASLGIYHIDYELYDAASNIIQPQSETDSGRFVVSNPPSNPYQSSDLSFSVNTSTEEVIFGQDISYTVTIWNNSDNDKRIRIWKDLNHFWEVEFLEEVVVPSKGSLDRTYVQNSSRFVSWAFYFPTINVHFFEENGNSIAKPYYILASETSPYVYIGTAGKRMQALIYPSVELSVMTDKPFYAKGEAVNLTLNVLNKKNASYTANVKIRVANPSNASVYSSSLDIGIPAGGSSAQNLSFILPPATSNGFYVISADAFDSTGKKIGGSSASFEVPSAVLSIKPVLPAVFMPDTSFRALFDVKNIWLTDVTDASLKVSFTDPNGKVLYETAQPFALTAGQNSTFSHDIPAGPVVYGDYVLRYVLQYGEKTALGEKKIKRDYIIQQHFNKPSYAAGETLDFAINIYSNGAFVDNLQLSTSVPGLSYSRDESLSLQPGQAGDFSYDIPLPMSTLSGKYLISANLTRGRASDFYFYIPNPKLSITMSEANTSIAGDKLQIKLLNDGGGASSYTMNIELRDARDLAVQKNISTGTLNAKAEKIFDLIIPSGAFTGPYVIEADAVDQNTSAKDSKSKNLDISGVSGSVSVRTERDIYLSTEGINAFADITGTGTSIPDAALEIKVVPALITGTIRGTVVHSETYLAIPGVKISSGDKVTYTTNQGEYVLAGIPIGAQRISILSPGLDMVISDIDVIEGGQIFDAQLKPSKYGKLKGLLKDALTGAAITGAKVELKPKEVISEEQISRIAHSGFDGRFEINKIAAGAYALRFVKDGYYPLDAEIRQR